MIPQHIVVVYWITCYNCTFYNKPANINTLMSLNSSTHMIVTSNSLYKIIFKISKYHFSFEITRLLALTGGKNGQ